MRRFIYVNINMMVLSRVNIIDKQNRNINSIEQIKA
jgi:hypothetical protein